MERLTGQLVMLAILLIIVVVGFALSKWAKQYNLQYEAQQGKDQLARVSGTLRKRAFVLWQEDYKDIGDEQTSIRTRMSLQVAGMPESLMMYERPPNSYEGLTNFLANVNEGFTGQHLPDAFPTGDTIFDDKWVTRAIDTVAARAWLASGRHKLELEEFITQKEFDLNGEGLVWTGSTPRTAEDIEATARKLEHYARRLEIY